MILGAFIHNRSDYLLSYSIEIKMATLIVDGKEYELTEQQVAPMKYVEEATAVEKGKVRTH